MWGLKFVAYQHFSHTSLRNIENNSKKDKKVLDNPLPLVYIKYVEWLRGNRDELRYCSE